MVIWYQLASIIVAGSISSLLSARTRCHVESHIIDNTASGVLWYTERKAALVAWVDPWSSVRGKGLVDGWVVGAFLKRDLKVSSESFLTERLHQLAVNYIHTAKFFMVPEIVELCFQRWPFIQEFQNIITYNFPSPLSSILFSWQVEALLLIPTHKFSIL